MIFHVQRYSKHMCGCSTLLCTLVYDNKTISFTENAFGSTLVFHYLTLSPRFIDTHVHVIERTALESGEEEQRDNGLPTFQNSMESTLFFGQRCSFMKTQIFLFFQLKLLLWCRKAFFTFYQMHLARFSQPHGNAS